MFGNIKNTKIPVYMINGFLESGKTDFISFQGVKKNKHHP